MAFPRSRRWRRSGDFQRPGSAALVTISSPGAGHAGGLPTYDPDRDVRYGAYATPGPLDDKIVMRGQNTARRPRHGPHLRTYNRLRHVRVTSPTRAASTG